MILPNFDFEHESFCQNYKTIAGVDEVGRGCFAGPVIAGCVVFDSEFIGGVKTVEVLINDSKKMSAKSREKADIWIKNNSMSWGIGESTVEEINSLGIKKATEVAYRNAIQNAHKKLQQNIDFLLIDAFFAPNVEELPETNQLPIIKGDTKSMSIAAASIIAKVYRDKLMSDLSATKTYAPYGWGKNKGYGTKDHRQAISNNGISDLHRLLFVRKYT